jgi:SAM-dependent methyltransferase
VTTALRERLFWDHAAHEDGPAAAAYRDPIPNQEFVDTLDKCGLPADGCLLDLGCGPGRLAFAVAEYSDCVHVVGLDVSMAMLHGAPYHPHVVYVHGDGRTLPFPADHFAGGWSVLLFQHLGPGAIHPYLRDLARVLRPAAPFVIQWVVGDQRQPFAYKYDVQWMANAARNAGLTIKGYSKGLLLPEWGWLTVTS